MKSKLKPTLSWKEAPDIIGIEELMKIMGIGRNQALVIFNRSDFPRIPDAGKKADKEAVKLYFQGIKVKENQKNAIAYMTFLEIKELNQKFDTLGGNEAYEEIQTGT